MTFLEIRDGLSININDIIKIERTNDLTCLVYTQAGIETSNFPYNVLLEILENEKEEPLNAKLDAFLSQAGHFAG